MLEELIMAGKYYQRTVDTVSRVLLSIHDTSTMVHTNETIKNANLSHNGQTYSLSKDVCISEK